MDRFVRLRKRNCLQDEALASKSRKAAGTHAVEETGAVDEVASPTRRCLRSSRQKAAEPESEKSAKCVVMIDEAPVEKTVRGGRKATVRDDKKEELKARMKRLDEMKARVSVPEPVATAPVVVPCQPAVETKKKLNKAELKRRIEEFNRNLAQLQSVETPAEVKEEKKPVETPPLPAHLKFKELASEQIDLSSTLTLPKAYSLLFDCFKASDTIVKFLFNRDEVCTFLKLKMGVQNITKQTFAHKQLAQISAVYPQAYLLKYEKLFIDFKNDYHLIIAPNMDGTQLSNT